VIEGVVQRLQHTHEIEGVVHRLRRTHVSSVAVELEATAGTRSGGVTLSGLDPRRLSGLKELRPGTQLRVSGLHPECAPTLGRAARIGGQLRR
jgi:hypothetical protein